MNLGGSELVGVSSVHVDHDRISWPDSLGDVIGGVAGQDLLGHGHRTCPSLGYRQLDPPLLERSGKRKETTFLDDQLSDWVVLVVKLLEMGRGKLE